MRAPLDIDFRRPTNLPSLCKYLGIDEEFGNQLITPEKRRRLFFEHRIPKRGHLNVGKHRTVWEPSELVANIYKSFTRRFDLFLRKVLPDYPTACSYGYVRGRSSLHNANRHLMAPIILHADIRNFFPSISIGRIETALQAVGINEEVAHILAQFLTIDDKLPLGVHSSPIIANLCCRELDHKLSDLAKTCGCTYTRYADDITISGKTVPQKEEVTAILAEEGFSLSERKFRITKSGQAHFVTGLSVSDKNGPHVPKKMKRKLRQELHFCERYGLNSHLRRTALDIDCNYIQRGVNRIDGMVRYVSHIEKTWLQN